MWLQRRAIETRDYLQPTTCEQGIGYLFHRPLSSYVNALLDAGFTLRRMMEPQLSEEGARLLGNDCDCYVPSFVALQLAKR